MGHETSLHITHLTLGKPDLQSVQCRDIIILTQQLPTVRVAIIVLDECWMLMSFMNSRLLFNTEEFLH